MARCVTAAVLGLPKNRAPCESRGSLHENESEIDRDDPYRDGPESTSGNDDGEKSGGANVRDCVTDCALSGAESGEKGLVKCPKCVFALDRQVLTLRWSRSPRRSLLRSLESSRTRSRESSRLDPRRSLDSSRPRRGSSVRRGKGNVSGAP